MRKLLIFVFLLLSLKTFSAGYTIQSYIKRYEKLAKQEQEKFKIPYQVILAQAILESNYGNSDMSGAEVNNHFGIKEKGNVKGYQHREGKFKIFKTTWDCYRFHSEIIDGYVKSKKPKNLKNYKDWCYFIASCGYAEDKDYATKLIFLIKKYIE